MTRSDFHTQIANNDDAQNMSSRIQCNVSPTNGGQWQFIDKIFDIVTTMTL